MGNDLTLDFRLDGNGTDHRGTGWAEPEGTGAWMLGQQSLLVLPRPEVSGDYRLDLDLGALTGPGHPSQRLVVGVNGVVLAEFVLVNDGVEHCMLPWSVIGREPGLTLVLLHPDAWRPSELTGGEGDQREISVFLRSARLSLHQAAPAASPAARAAAPTPVPASPTRPVPATPAPAASAPAASAPAAPKPPAPPPSAPAARKPAAPVPATAAPSATRPQASTQPAARPVAPSPASQAAPPSPTPPPRPTPVPAASRTATQAQEARAPWWKKLLG